MALSLSQRDLKTIWHPFTQHKLVEPAIPIVRGKGASLFDEEGNEYIDAIASWWMNLHGHSHPYLKEALVKQADTLEHVIFADFTHEPAVRLAERLLGHLPDNQQRIFYSDNGSTAVEVGLKMCFQYWHNIGRPRTKILAFEGAYHGDTFGAMSVGGRSPFTEPYAPFLFDVIFVEPPLPGREAQSLAQLKAILHEHNGQVAGFVYEPRVQGAGGMRMYAPQALDRLLAACREEQVMLIADEVMVGFGRTGKMWANDHLQNKADVFCLSKGLTGGTMALGATSCTAKIFEAFWSDDRLKTLFHGHSCTGNPLACAVGLASLDLTESEENWKRIARIEASHQKFAQRISQFDRVKDLRQHGVILAFDIQNKENTSYFNRLRDEIWKYFLDRRLLMRPLGNTVYILPPYCITEDQLNTVYDAIEELMVMLENEERF